MNKNKLVEEDIARAKQLEEMELIRDSIIEKIESIKIEQTENEKTISRKEEIFETKTGKLRYIREEKEAIFNSFQNALNENRTLKQNQQKLKPEKNKKKSVGIFGSILGLLKKDKFDSIDVSDGKISKTNVNINQKTIAKDFDKPGQSFFALNKDFQAHNLKSALNNGVDRISTYSVEPEQPVLEVCKKEGDAQNGILAKEVQAHEVDTEFVSGDEQDDLDFDKASVDEEVYM